MTMLPPSPLIPMKALKATGILLLYLLLIFGAGLGIGQIVLILSNYMSEDVAIAVVILAILVSPILAIWWRDIYDSL